MAGLSLRVGDLPYLGFQVSQQEKCLAEQGIAYQHSVTGMADAAAGHYSNDPSRRLGSARQPLPTLALGTGPHVRARRAEAETLAGAFRRAAQHSFRSRQFAGRSAMSSYLSQGVERLLRTLEPHGRPEGDASFPPPSRRTEMLPRTNGNESIADWFVNAVDTALDGNPEACTIEPNLGVFASIKWKAATRLTFVQMQTVVCNKPLTELYETSRDPRQWDESIKTYYLRLDYDLLALGGIYSHPHPHVHVSLEVCVEIPSRHGGRRKRPRRFHRLRIQEFLP